MSMASTLEKRLTREESRARTRSRLLDAAESLFVERGFSGTSVEEIAERSGFTRGAFYSNFDDKDDIFVALLDRNLTTRIAEVSEMMHRAPSLDDAFVLIRRSNERRVIKPWVILYTEFWLYAMRNPKAKPKLAAFLRTEREAYGRAIKAQFDAAGLESPIPLEDAALIIQILDEGAVRHRPVDPRGIRDTFFFDSALLLLEAGLPLARERQKQSRK